MRTGYYVMGAGSSLTYTGADITTIAADANLVFDNSNGTVNGQILNLAGGSHAPFWRDSTTLASLHAPATNP